jgi:hypothetical protein
MRTPYFVLLLAFFVQACSFGAPAPLPPTDTPTPTASVTPFFTPTITASPTIVRIPTQNFDQPVSTPFVIPLYIGSVTATPFSFDAFAPTPLPAGPGAGFASVEVGDNKIYWGGCKYNRTTIIVEVEDPEEVFSVIIFTRTKLLKEEDTTPWTSGNVMYNNGNGKFTYLMRGNDVKGPIPTRRSWVLFQLVATNIKGEEIGRSRIFEDSIQLSPCMCLDPSTGCPPTPIKTVKP